MSSTWASAMQGDSGGTTTVTTTYGGSSSGSGSGGGGSSTTTTTWGGPFGWATSGGSTVSSNYTNTTPATTGTPSAAPALTPAADPNNAGTQMEVKGEGGGGNQAGGGGGTDNGGEPPEEQKKDAIIQQIRRLPPSGELCAACHPVQQKGAVIYFDPHAIADGGFGNFVTSHHDITFDVNDADSEALQGRIYKDLSSFKYFNDGAITVANVSLSEDGKSAAFDALGIMGVRSDLLNSDAVSVAIRLAPDQSALVGTTLAGHMLEGQRYWQVQVTPNGNGSSTVLIITGPEDRTISILNYIGNIAMGSSNRMMVWDQYLLNIKKAYNSSSPAMPNNSEINLNTSRFTGLIDPQFP